MLLRPLWLDMLRFLLGCFVAVFFAASFFSPFPVDAAENVFINTIQERGYLKVGLPPYNTPPAYYLEPGSDELQGFDIDLAQGLASKLGVGIQFDRSSTNLNQLVERVGAEDFDFAIGKLGLTYKRLYNAFPIQYMSFRHALLADRKFVASLGIDPDDPSFGETLRQSKIKIGSIENSIWETESKENFPNAEFIGFKNWNAAKDALINYDEKSGTPIIDAIYRDVTEIKPIVYDKPELSLEYVPILFDNIIDRKSIYLSEKGKIGLFDFVDNYLKEEWGGIKSDQDILDEFESFYLASKS